MDELHAFTALDRGVVGTGRDRLPALRALREAGAACNAFHPGSDR